MAWFLDVARDRVLEHGGSMDGRRAYLMQTARTCLASVRPFTAFMIPS